MITTASAETYERALNRAHTEHIVIRSEFMYAGNHLWSVENPKYEDGCYTVRLNAGSWALTCNCKAAEYGHMCKHVALVMEDIKRQEAEDHEHPHDADWS